MALLSPDNPYNRLRTVLNVHLLQTQRSCLQYDQENIGKKYQKEHQKKLKFTYKEQKEFETIDDDIAKLEEKIEQLDEEIMENATNSGKLAELTQQKEETEEALNEKMDRWVYLNDLAEQIANQ